MVVRAAGSSGLSSSDRRDAVGGTLLLLVCCAVPIVLAAQLFFSLVRSGDYAVDFQSSYWSSAHDVLHGHSPLPPPDPSAPSQGKAFPSGPYPPAVAVLFLPFALLPKDVASVLFTFLLLFSVFAALRLLDVRDWRCYTAVCAWAPIFSGLQSGNLTLVLLPALAAIWRFRDRLRFFIPIAGIAFALKLFLWPVVIWLIATRRYAATALSFAVAAAITLATWSVVGLGSIRHYPAVLRIFSEYYGRVSYTLFAFLWQLGVPDPIARAAAIAVGVVSLLAIVAAVRWRRGDKTSFALAVGAAILCSPIVWLHYFALALVPLAVFSPTFSLAWLLPAFLWASPFAVTHLSPRVTLPFAVSLAMIVLARRSANNGPRLT
jgi:hypothetical protein